MADACSRHVLGDIDTEFEQFAMNAGQLPTADWSGQQQRQAKRPTPLRLVITEFEAG